jgi:peptide chain release factor 1
MVSLTDNLLRKLEEIDAHYAVIEADLLDPEVLSDHRRVRTLSIKKSAMQSIVNQFRHWKLLQANRAEAEHVVREETDAELVELARGEFVQATEQSTLLLDELLALLVTADDRAVSSLILEIRAGVGGDEAALWAGDLVEMYSNYAMTKQWVCETLERSSGDSGGYKSALLSVSGEGAWSNLCFEGGTHQVKRVPATETQGRVHTSTATVAVLPEPEEIQIQLDLADVKEMITTATGPGGQNVNKVSTAVHLIHEPTGIEVRMQDTKSQSQNREKAWKLLRARLYELQKAEADAERAQQRNSMIGSGSRAEKIRTYRAKENLAVDHRLGSSFNLERILSGELQPIVDALIELETAQRLADL